MIHKFAILSLVLLSFVGCAKVNDSKQPQGITGTWILRKTTYPAGYERYYPQDKQNACLILSEDTTLYECRFTYTETGVVVMAGIMEKSRIEPDGNDRVLLMQRGAMRPLIVHDDTTIVTQLYGMRYTWVRNTQLSEQCVQEMRNIIAHANKNPDGELVQYAISTSERELQDTNYRLLVLLVVLKLLLVSVIIYARRTYQHKRHVERRLAQIKEESSFRHQQVAQVMQSVVDEFFVSDYYHTLRQKITQGKVLNPQEWRELEEQLRTVFPDFMRHLSALCRLSTTEWHVCLLIKLRFTPTEIAGTLAKETSTVSSIRSRLYKKIFSKNGSSKDWDSFILSL